jgi:hypothetical protein
LVNLEVEVEVEVVSEAEAALRASAGIDENVEEP